MIVTKAQVYSCLEYVLNATTSENKCGKSLGLRKYATISRYYCTRTREHPGICLSTSNNGLLYDWTGNPDSLGV